MTSGYHLSGHFYTQCKLYKTWISGYSWSGSSAIHVSGLTGASLNGHFCTADVVSSFVDESSVKIQISVVADFVHNIKTTLRGRTIRPVVHRTDHSLWICCGLLDNAVFAFSALTLLRGGVLAWLSAWSETQTSIWPSWCHCLLLQ